MPLTSLRASIVGHYSLVISMALLLGSACTWISADDLTRTGGDPIPDSGDTDQERPQDLDGDGFSVEDGDCWDDPASILAGFVVVPSTYSDRMGVPLSWTQPQAAQVHPNAVDLPYDGVDADCAFDDDFDQDGDGFRSNAYPDASGVFGDDCFDGSSLDPLAPTGKVPEDVNPGAAEIWYDGFDDNCDGNDCDQDGDGYRRDGATVWDTSHGFCPMEDCDDTDPDVFPDPSIPEVWYNGIDENCDGNEGDQDGDGYWADDYNERVIAAGARPLPVPVGSEGDCDDLLATTFPAAEDYCDSVDSDCDGQVAGPESGDAESFFEDADGDGHGDLSAPISACTAPEGYVLSWDDCDDEDATSWPGATEYCDTADNDCDGLVDNDAADASTWYLDDDSDDYGVSDTSTVACTPPTGYVGATGDCDDGDPVVNPGVYFDDNSDMLVDNDCDGYVDEDSIDPFDLIISEFSNNSTAGSDEPGHRTIDANWVEIYNNESFAISLSNWILMTCLMEGSYTSSWEDCASTSGIAISPAAGLVVGARSFIVLCQDASVFLDPSNCDYEYGDTESWTGTSPESFAYSSHSLDFGITEGILLLRLAGSHIDEIGYYSPGWPNESLRSLCLKPAYLSPASHNAPFNWSYARGGSVYWASDPERNYGTPGRANSTSICY